jgi:hypothetical protein
MDETKGDTVMKRLLLSATVAILVLKGVDVAAAAELPTYQSMGLPISPVQATVVGSGHEQESSPLPALTFGGMPASPVQIAILTPHRHVVGELATQAITEPTTVGRAR